VALNASVVTNTRTIPIESFFDPLNGTVLATKEIVTEVDVPTPASGTKQAFIKFAQRKAIDFAIASVAVLLTLNGTQVTAARIALGGVAPTPMRSTAAETAIVGQTLSATTAAAAAKAATSAATVLPYNTYKVPIVQSLVAQALTTAT
jgi:CO/xanthine dehydrogenase FAD-binding subunit